MKEQRQPDGWPPDETPDIHLDVTPPVGSWSRGGGVLRYDPAPGWVDLADTTDTDPPSGYVQPAVSVSITWAATDGSKPENVTIDWKTNPAVDDLVNVLDAVIQAGHTQYMIDPAAAVPRASTAGFDPGPLDGVTRADTSQDPPTCPAWLDLGERGEYAHTHRCALDVGHDPVEPEGRQHRCHCGGLFATDAEQPSVPGRASKQRRVERDR